MKIEIEIGENLLTILNEAFPDDKKDMLEIIFSNRFKKLKNIIINNHKLE